MISVKTIVPDVLKTVGGGVLAPAAAADILQWLTAYDGVTPFVDKKNLVDSPDIEGVNCLSFNGTTQYARSATTPDYDWLEGSARIKVTFGAQTSADVAMTVGYVNGALANTLALLTNGGDLSFRVYNGSGTYIFVNTPFNENEDLDVLIEWSASAGTISITSNGVTATSTGKVIGDFPNGYPATANAQERLKFGSDNSGQLACNCTISYVRFGNTQYSLSEGSGFPLDTSGGGIDCDFNTGVWINRQLAANPHLTDNLDGWNASGWTWENGTARHTPGSISSMYQNILAVGKEYTMSMDIAGISAGNVAMKTGISTGSGPLTAVGHYEYTDVCVSDGLARFTPSTDFEGRIDNLQVFQTGVSIESANLAAGHTPALVSDVSSGYHRLTGDIGNNGVFDFTIDASFADLVTDRYLFQAPDMSARFTTTGGSSYVRCAFAGAGFNINTPAGHDALIRHQYRVTGDGSTMSLYVDGTFSDSAPIGTSIDASLYVDLLAGSFKGTCYSATFVSDSVNYDLVPIEGGKWLERNGNNVYAPTGTIVTRYSTALNETVDGKIVPLPTKSQLTFDGVGDYVSADIVPPSYPVIIEAEYRTTTNAGQVLVSMSDISLNGDYILLQVVDLNTVACFFRNAEGTSYFLSYDSSDITDGNFHTVKVVVNSANDANLYFDGVLRDTETGGGFIIPANIDTLTLGANRRSTSPSGASFLDGSLRSAKVSGLFEYDFTDYLGKTTDTITDLSGNGNDGTISYTDLEAMWAKRWSNRVLGPDSAVSSYGAGQYIDLGVKGTPNTKIEVDCIFDGVSSGDRGVIGDVASPTSRFSIYANPISNFKYACGSNFYQTIAFDTDRHTFAITGRGECYFDGVLRSTIDASTLTQTTSNIKLMSMNTTGGFSGSVYSAKVWESEVLVRDMVPQLDGTFLDRVENKVYSNDGTGTLVTTNLVSDGEGVVVDSANYLPIEWVGGYVHNNSEASIIQTDGTLVVLIEVTGTGTVADGYYYASGTYLGETEYSHVTEPYILTFNGTGWGIFGAEVWESQASATRVPPKVWANVGSSGSPAPTLVYDSFWVNDDGTFKAIQYSDLVAHQSSLQNLWIKWAKINGWCHVEELIQYRLDTVLSEADKAKNIAYLGASGCGIPAPAPLSSYYAIDQIGNYAVDQSGDRFIAIQ